MWRADRRNIKNYRKNNLIELSTPRRNYRVSSNIK